jgi:protein O-mannosyl-transferase
MKRNRNPRRKQERRDEHQGKWFESWVAPSLIPCFAFILYANTLHHAFVYDDVEGIVNNPLVAGFDSLWKIFRFAAEPWRPVIQLSHAITHYFFAFDPTYYHLINILIHAFNSLLVYGIARKLGQRWLKDASRFALAAALLFASHPLLSEGVAYIWGRSSSLCALFYFGAILAVFMAEDAEGKRRVAWYSLAVFCGFLAWKAKEEAISLPLVIAAFFAILGRWRVLALLTPIPFLIAAMRWADISRLYTKVAENQALVVTGLSPSLPSFLYFLTHIKVSVFYYLRRFLLPTSLNADPQIDPVTGISDPYFLFGALVLVTMAVCAIAAVRKKPVLSFAVLAFLCSPLAAYAVMPLADVAAEHRVYIAGLGFALFSAWSLTRRPKFTLPLLAAVTLLYSGLTIQRNFVWKDGVTLWEDTAEKSPGLARPHLNLGQAYQMQGLLDKALSEYRRATEINPKLTAAYVNMGVIYFSWGKLDESESVLKKAVECSPGLPAPYMNLGVLYFQRNDPAAALRYMDKAISLGDSHFLRFAKGDIYSKLGHVDDAVHEYEAAARLSPDLPAVKAEAEARIRMLRQPGR